MALDQNSTLKRLLSTLAIFTGREKECEEKESQNRYTREECNLAYTFNPALYERFNYMGFSCVCSSVIFSPEIFYMEMF